jgi:hypothetical protein
MGTNIRKNQGDIKNSLWLSFFCQYFYSALFGKLFEDIFAGYELKAGNSNSIIFNNED